MILPCISFHIGGENRNANKLHIKHNQMLFIHITVKFLVIYKGPQVKLVEKFHVMVILVWL